MRVTIAQEKQVTKEFLLCPGGGLEMRARKDSSTAGSCDLILVLSNLNVSVGTLYQFMEAMLTGLQKASDQSSDESHVLKDDTNGKKEKAQGETHWAIPQKEVSLPSSEKIDNRSKELLAFSKGMADGSGLARCTQVVQSIENNQNPLFGAGKAESMELMVQTSHLAAGQHLLRLLLDRY